MALAADWPEVAMRPIRLAALSAEALRELDHLYHTTRDVRVRTRAQMVPLAAEQGLVAAEIAPIVRQDEETVRRWFARYLAEGVARGCPTRRGPGRRRRRPPPTANGSSGSRAAGPAP
jgi:hypothetical protein